jgi:hypothetical protein
MRNFIVKLWEDLFPHKHQMFVDVCEIDTMGGKRRYTAYRCSKCDYIDFNHSYTNYKRSY